MMPILSQQIVLLWGEQSLYFRELQKYLLQFGAALEVVTARELPKRTKKVINEFSFVFVKCLIETENYKRARELRQLGYEGNIFLLNPHGATNKRALTMARELKLQVIAEPQVSQELLRHFMQIEIGRSGLTHDNLSN